MSYEDIERLRKKARNASLVGILICIIVPILVAYYLGSVELAIFAFIISFIISRFIVAKPESEFVSAYKHYYVYLALQRIFTNLQYFPDEGINSNVIKNTETMNMGDRYSANDLIEGTYKNINFTQSDVHIEEKHEYYDKDGHRRVDWVTIFRGRWMVFDFNKSFIANLQICQKGFKNSKLNKLFSSSSFNRVNMEDLEFNKMFKTYALVEHDAFYVLTPHLMEKIKTLTKKIRGKLIFCFDGNKLHVGINNNKDSFEPSIFFKLKEEKVLNNISSEIKLITDFVDELDLDVNIFREGV